MIYLFKMVDLSIISCMVICYICKRLPECNEYMAMGQVTYETTGGTIHIHQLFPGTGWKV